jgi:hypothetical protein
MSIIDVIYVTKVTGRGHKDPVGGCERQATIRSSVRISSVIDHKIISACTLSRGEG